MDFETVNLMYSQTPMEKYDNIAQSWVNKNFYNSPLVREIKQEDYPFDNEYKTYEAQVDTVGDFNTNTNKIDGNYLSIQFKDCLHETIRGQKFIYENDTYLCYKPMEELTRISKSYVIKCTNTLRWLKPSTGEIVQEPCFLGWEMTSTNPNVTKVATTENRRLVLLIQGNEDTNEIEVNQRFLISKKKAFKVNQVYKENLDHLDEEYSSLIKIYLEWDTVLTDMDNTDLLIADYYNYDYELSINSDDLSLTNGATGTLTANVTMNGNTIEPDLKWISSDSDVVSIDSLGNYKVIGLSDSTALISCLIEANENVSDSINIDIVEIPDLTKELLMSPSDIEYIRKGTSKTIEFGVYENGVLTSDIVAVVPSGADSSKYSITSATNSIVVECLDYTSDKLILTFTSGILERTIEIRLVGIM